MSWSYKKAGVDIEKGNSWIHVIDRIMKKHKTDPSIIGGIGSFAGLYDLDGINFLAACCDGVGTKLEIAKKTGSYSGLGQDLVAMSLNDLVTCNARPLFFLDYIACGKLDTEVLAKIMEGITDSCENCNCSLLGGETAEMPDVYPEEGFDLAGFAVGTGTIEKIIDGSKVKPGDIMIGLPSSGLHSNGFSLVRKILEYGDLDKHFEGSEAVIGDMLLAPTRLYVIQALKCASSGLVNAMAHITGGGLLENITRAIPSDLEAEIDFYSWERPEIYRFIEKRGIDENEMRRVFNLGVGFVFVVPSEHKDQVMTDLKEIGETPFEIGVIREK
jgi:phosphoribosylformylglycinamidine cyclo-ligase